MHSTFNNDGGSSSSNQTTPNADTSSPTETQSRPQQIGTPLFEGDQPWVSDQMNQMNPPASLSENEDQGSTSESGPPGAEGEEQPREGTPARLTPAGTRQSRRQNRRMMVLNVGEIYSYGQFCVVKKHLRLGCAVVSLIAEFYYGVATRHLQLDRVPEGEMVRWSVRGMDLAVKKHVDKETNVHDGVSLFVWWGHRTEVVTPLSGQALADEFDDMIRIAQACEESQPQPDEIPVPLFMDVQDCAQHAPATSRSSCSLDA